MGADNFEIGINASKLAIIFLMMVSLVPMLVWLERRGSAFIQNRLGPNRIGPLGLTQLMADAVKFITKEEFLPEKGRQFAFRFAPIIAIIPAALAFGAIPLSKPIQIEVFEMFGAAYGPYTFYFQTFHFGVGIVFVLGVSSLAAYGLLMAGWGSNNKYALLGALRASAQMISYELALGLALVGALLVYGTFDFLEITKQQEGPLTFMLFDHKHIYSWLPNWGIFYQPLGAILYFSAIFAETNRLPFDLPEAEGELVAGYHTEYGGMKMNLFFIGEYGHMMVGSALMVIFYFGGYHIPWVSEEAFTQAIQSMGSLPIIGELTNNKVSVLSAILYHFVFLAKVFFFLWVFIWVRWTLPRFRYDQLMDLGWKTMLPWALCNTIATAIIIFVARM